MLTYLIFTIEDLIATAVLVGLAFSYARASNGKFSTKVVAGGVIAALLFSVVMAVMKQTTNMVDTGTWNMRIFVVAAIAFLVFLICLIRPLAKRNFGSILGTFGLSLFVFCRVFYKVPDVYLYPFNFSLSESTIISSDFFSRLAGYTLGLVIVVLVCVGLVKSLKSLTRRPIGIALVIVAVVLDAVQIMTCLQTMLARRIIGQNHELFEVVKFFSNNATAFMFIIMAVAIVLSVLVIVMSLRDAEPYRNPAEHRKNKARWRNRRRWAICLIVCMAVSVVTLTVVKDFENRGPELSVSEECEIHDGALYIPFAQVEDGHLHRFTYMTEAGYTTKSGYVTSGDVGIRIIVIKKPGANTYGIGLDACEICGQTGYYERDGQVVCIKCDVVMNINTIGFKGGCNPIPIEYAIDDGYIIVPIDGLCDYEKTFK